MILIAGIDVGTRMTKCVLLDAETDHILITSCKPSGHDFAKTSVAILDEALAAANLNAESLQYIASTGFGRYQVPHKHIQITEITCHAMGAHYLYPGTRTVIDLGAQNARAIHVGEDGRVKKFRMNDKCASGAGRFLERVAKGLELELDEIGGLSMRSKDPQPISSICAVLAESEVINLVTVGYPVEDILMGTNLSISERIVALIRQVGVDEEVTMTGGVTRNAGMVQAVETKLGTRLNVHILSEYAGALGACLLAERRIQKLRLTEAAAAGAT